MLELRSILSPLVASVAAGKARGMSQRTRLIILGACIGGLTYVFGGCFLSAFYVPDVVIYAWFFFLAIGSLVVLAWLKWPRWKFW